MDSIVKKLKSIDISMGIGETSRITGATVTQIRYWEKKGFIHPIRHQTGGNKRYSLKTMTKIIIIKSFMDDGYTLAKAGEMIKAHYQDVDTFRTIVTQRLVGLTHDNDITRLNLGPIDNDDGFNLVIEVRGKQVHLLKRPQSHEPG
ncbi:MerR family transcriptional regulator [Schleiferilactobacillus perolens]|uniref:MerR family transcriptional regulator n=1 Tax=Schleiferilactobacillus perolens TaxID=100468 RepID=UPI0023525CFD|nr:MerR family transcriptional regulator [Schleiferilactobacillus perolens]MCI1890589.1 MerR family transcriptional regulator [Schleiferilactobacillus harbinensis]MCI1912196.1 MerR family transcriptional regulator [Schleiferilactobacillus harbinensis]MCI2172232.1 MerR family transcriptional regulator [Schleiferilactobacillus perolens]